MMNNIEALLYRNHELTERAERSRAEKLKTFARKRGLLERLNLDPLSLIIGFMIGGAFSTSLTWIITTWIWRARA